MEVLRLRCLTVLLVALAWTVRASTRPERNPSKELKECFGPESDRDRQTSPYFERCGLPEKRWLVITERRSGSRWLVNTMAERTGEVVPYTSEIGNCHGCYCGLVGAKPGGPEDRECTCRLAGYYSKFADQLTESTGDGACDNYHHYGFKWMHAPQYTEEGSFDVLARSLCDLDIPVAFMWRRNVLRRIISELSNHEQSHSGVPRAS